MDGLKGFAEVAEHILYETFGLLVPGGAFALAIAAALGGEALGALIVFVANHPWLSLAGAYVLGYPVQGISRPITEAFEWLLRLPGRLLIGGLLRLLPRSARGWVEARLASFEKRMTGRHSHAPVETAPDTVDFENLSAQYWAIRLGIEGGQRLSKRQVQDLSFSVLTPERQQLDRFRAAASLARGVAVAVTAAFVVLFWQLWVGDLEPSNARIVILMGLAVAFYGLLQRADMYDGLWRSIIPAQFLCAVTRDGRLARSSDSAPVIAEPALPAGVIGQAERYSRPPDAVSGGAMGPNMGPNP